MTVNYKSDIKSYIKIPSYLLSVINTANSDLYGGPIYLNKNGEEASCFDDAYHHAFDFSRACQIIGNWFESLPFDSLYWEEWSGCVMESLSQEEEIDGELIEPDYQGIYEIESREIKRIIFGKELARYV